MSVSNGIGSGGGVSRMVTETISTRSFRRPSASAGISEIFCATSSPFDHATEHGELIVERRLIAHAQEELRARGIRLARLQHGRHRAARVLLRDSPERAPSGFNTPKPARAVERLLRRILRQRIAALHDPPEHRAMERRPRVRALLGQLHEVADVIRRALGQQLNHDRAGRGLDDSLLVLHLIERQRRGEEPALGGWRLRGRWLRGRRLPLCGLRGDRRRHQQCDERESKQAAGDDRPIHAAILPTSFDP